MHHVYVNAKVCPVHFNGFTIFFSKIQMSFQFYDFENDYNVFRQVCL